MLWVTGSVTNRPEERPIVTGLPQVRPPSVERIASSRARLPLVISANTSSSDPSRLTRTRLVPGQLCELCGSYSFRGLDQLRPPSVVRENRLKPLRKFG